MLNDVMCFRPGGDLAYSKVIVIRLRKLYVRKKLLDTNILNILRLPASLVRTKSFDLLPDELVHLILAEQLFC